LNSKIYLNDGLKKESSDKIEIENYLSQGFKVDIDFSIDAILKNGIDENIKSFFPNIWLEYTKFLFLSKFKLTSQDLTIVTDERPSHKFRKSTVTKRAILINNKQHQPKKISINQYGGIKSTTETFRINHGDFIEIKQLTSDNSNNKIERYKVIYIKGTGLCLHFN